MRISHWCEGEGDSLIRLLMTGGTANPPVYADQDTSATNGKFLNYFFVPKIRFQNKSKMPISILEVRGDASEYHWLPDTTLNLEPLK